jgi:hypothetical protein
MNVTFKNVKASVLLRNGGSDVVSLEVDKPAPFPPGISNPRLRLSFECLKDDGVRYCREHLGLHPDVIDSRRPGGWSSV